MWRRNLGPHTQVGSAGATSGAQAVLTAEVAAARAALAVEAKGSAIRAVDTPRALRRTRSTCVWARRRDEKGGKEGEGTGS